MSWILVKTAPEISLKSKFVRRQFFDKLCANVEKALQANSIRHSPFQRRPGRIFFQTVQEKRALSALAFVFGIHSVALAEKVLFLDFNDLSFQAAELSAFELKNAKSFAVRVSRSGAHSFSSQEAAAQVGKEIQQQMPKLKVDLDAPQKEVFVEIDGANAFVYFSEKKGLNGLPVGVSGVVGISLSGKKEETGAAKAMLKRGCSLVVRGGTPKQLKELEKWNSFQPLAWKGKVEAEVVSFKDVKKALKALRDKKQFKLAPLVLQ
ncbi:MAG: THUMP domain-containing protein [Candidatus Diapherotrites archaeon]